MSKPGFPPTARVAAAASAVALLGLAAGCSSGKSSSASAGSASSSTAGPSASSSAPSTSPAMTASSGGTGGTGTSGTTVNSGSATVGGAQTTVLTAPDGHTLYYFTSDTAGGKPTCTGGCASIWPGLMASSPTEAAIATGKLTVVGGQVAYNGHPLYEYSGDTAAGQANGEGVMGKWYVATPSLAAGAGPGNPMPSSSSSSSTSGGGSGGYGKY